MALRSSRAVLFDLDGTLVDTVGTRVQAWLEVFAQVGIASDPGHVGSLMGSDGRFVALEVAGARGRALTDTEAADIDRRAGVRFGELNVKPHALPGATDLLEFLDAAEVPWGIATSSRPEQVHASVQALGLRHQPRVTDGSHVRHAKPAPDLLLSAARQIGARPVDTWYVGDSRWDVLAAVAAGMTPVGVTTGAADEAQLRAAGAARTFPTLGDLHADLASRTLAGRSARRDQ